MKQYGYKVCYLEKGKQCYIRHFMTYTRRQALRVLRSYVRYPPPAHSDGHILKRPKWKIIPVNRNEILAGIWDEPPF